MAFSGSTPNGDIPEGPSLGLFEQIPSNSALKKSNVTRDTILTSSGPSTSNSDPHTSPRTNNPFAAAFQHQQKMRQEKQKQIFSTAPALSKPFITKNLDQPVFGTAPTTKQSIAKTSITPNAGSLDTKEDGQPVNPFQTKSSPPTDAASSPFSALKRNVPISAQQPASNPFAKTAKQSHQAQPSFLSGETAFPKFSSTNPFLQTTSTPSALQQQNPTHVGTGSGDAISEDAISGTSRGPNGIYASAINSPSFPSEKQLEAFTRPGFASATATPPFLPSVALPISPEKSNLQPRNPFKPQEHASEKQVITFKKESSTDVQPEKSTASETMKGANCISSASSTPFSKPRQSTPTTSWFPSQPSLNGINESQSEYAQRIHAQLQKDKLKPPPWPKEPGNPDNRSAMESFRESYKKYRDKVRASLIKAGLIDNPEVRKRLDEAIDFKGICEDMCPEFEKISRIVQYDVKMPEKTEGADGTMWPFPRLMVKALARSAAGQEAPLPMDVRSVTSLKRTLNYLIDTLLGDDSHLPSMHNFLWDRTRAIRRDFVFHSTMSDEEMLNQVYCLENITRFHATALHLLSQKGFAAEDFSEQQEREQLGKALLSLMQAYDDCKEKEVTCENEAEFRAYFILLNAHDPDFQNKVSEWGTRFWHDSDDVQTALTLVQAMQSVWDWRGPIKPSIPTTTSLGAFSSFFRIVETSKVSYTMACFAEIHFVHVRRGILRNVTRAYSRIRDSPRDLTVAVLNAMLRFDTDKEAFEFATQHGLEFSSNNTADAYLVLERTAHITSVPTVRQSFSWSLVERKRGNRQLPEVIRTTVFEDTTTLSLSQKDNANRSIFVDQTTPTEAHFGIRDDNRVKKALGETTNATSDIPDAAERLDAYTTPFSPFPFASTSSNFAAPVKSSATFSTPSPSVSNSDQVTPVKQNQASVAAASLVPKHSFNIEAQPSSASVDDIFRPFSSVTSSPSTVPNILPTPDFALTASKGLQLAKDKTSDIFGHPAASHTRLTSSQKTKESDPSSHLTARTSSSSLLAPTASTTSSTPEIFSRNASSETGAQESHTLDLTSASTVEKREETEVSKKQKHASTGDETTTSSMASPQRLQGPVFQKVAPKVAARTTAKVSRMDNFNKWFTLGDGGILDEFRVALVQHLVTQTLNLFVGEKVERQQREEDQQSWAEARSFKAYNLRVKFFYRWQHVARERALDRRARQARDEMRAYRSARRNEQRLAADKTTAEEHEKAAEARPMTSKEVKFLEELGYYGDFSVTSRRQKSSAASEKLTVPLSKNQDSDNKETTAMAGNLFATGVLCGARHEDGSTALVVQEDASPSSDAQPILNKKREQEQRAQRQQKRLPVRQSSKQDMTRTASRTKDFFTSEAFINTKRERSTFGSAAKESVDGDGLHSSLRSSHSPDSPKVAYYRRSMRSKGRLHGIFTRVSPKPNTDKANAAHEGMTNFMRYSNKQLSSPGNQAVGSTGGHIFVKDDDLWRASSPSLSSVSASAAGSQNMSNMRSGYWRLRAMGLVQMPNKQFLHESLALPMLQNGKRFSGVGSYGLPPPGPKSHDSENDHPDNTPPGLAANAGDDSEECLGEERQMSILGSSNGVLLSRKRLFSGSSYASQHRYSDESRRDGRAAGAVTSPLGVKKAKTRELQLSQRPEQQQDQLDETERVIQEMRETADAMDQGRNWFVEQTKLMENGATIWDQ